MELTIVAAGRGGDHYEEIAIGISTTRKGKFKVDYCYINSDYNKEYTGLSDSKIEHVKPHNSCFTHFPVAYLFQTLYKNGYECLMVGSEETEKYDGLWDYICQEVLEDKDYPFNSTPAWFQKIQMD